MACGWDMSPVGNAQEASAGLSWAKTRCHGQMPRFGEGNARPKSLRETQMVLLHPHGDNLSMVTIRLGYDRGPVYLGAGTSRVPIYAT